MKNKLKAEFDAESRVSVFWGTGASGASSFSLEYSRQLAQLGRKTLLIDADFLDPSLMVYLAIDNYPSGLQAGLRLASQNRLDATNLEQLLVKSKYSSELSYMAGIPVSGRFQTIEPESLSSMVELLRGWFDDLVIDLGCIVPEVLNSHLYGLQQQLIESSDFKYGVFRADPDGIAKLFWLPVDGELIANNYRPGSLGAGGKKALKSIIAETTGQTLLGVAEEDDQLISAVSKAVAVGEVSKKSAVSQLVRSLIQNRLDAAG